MEPKKLDHRVPLSEKDIRPAEPAQVEEVKQILHLLFSAVSAAKLFPPEHQTVVSLVSTLHGQLKSFLEANWKLELGIEEHAFTFEGQRVYSDPHQVKSLPFFFFKDGMQMLYFYRGLEQEEVKEFLTTIRLVSLQPPEEADIISALWEKDLANIRYLAPDDFLETKIGVGRTPLGIQVNPEELHRGRIDLTPEDLASMRNKLFAERASGETTSGADEGGPPDISPLPAPSDEEEMREIESLLLSNRRLSQQEEYLNLIVEIIYHEDRPDQFPAIAEVFKQYYQDAVEKLDFGRAAQLLKALREIEDVFDKQDKNKAALVSGLIQGLTQETALAGLQQSLDPGSVKDKGALLNYLKMVGPGAARVLGDLFEQWRDPGSRRQVLDILHHIGQNDSEALMRLAQEIRPDLTKEIIALLGGTRDKRVVPFLAGFLNSRHASVKLEAIRALGNSQDPAADRVLFGFASADEQAVRAAAARALKASPDTLILDHVLRLVAEKSFLKKGLEEIAAFLDFLGRSNSAEALLFLRRTLLESRFFSSPKQTGIRLCAVSALARMELPEAKEALRAGAGRRNRKIREACRRALNPDGEKG